MVFKVFAKGNGHVCMHSTLCEPTLDLQKTFGGRGFAPDPTGGAYSAPPDPLAGFQGRRFAARGREGEGRGGERRGGEFGPPPH
jgi:hypothetical protein